MDSDSDGKVLDSLLKKLQGGSYSSPSPDELVCLISSFLPTRTATYQSRAYLVLSAFCQAARESSPKNQSPDLVSQSLTNTFVPLVVSRLGDVEENSVIAAISFMAALFPVDQDAASCLFLRDGVADSVADSVDLFSSRELTLEVARLLSQASGHKSCRAVISPQSMQWLEAKSRQTVDTTLRAAAGIALIKLVRGRASDGSNVIGTEESQAGSNKNEELAKLMKGIVISGDNQSSLTEAVEGLAYLSVDPPLKEDLSRDAVFLTRLFSLVPRQREALRTTAAINSTLWYGIVVIVSNICIYRPRLSEEAVQIEKLKQMAKAGKRSGWETQDSGLNDDDHCRERARRLVAAGVLDVLTAIVYADSSGIRSSVGISFLSIVEDKENRGKVLQSGGAKTLALIIRHSMSLSQSDSNPSTKTFVPQGQLSAFQALAKLAITSSPIQVFGPNEGTMYDAIRPFALLVLHPSSTLLQQFEAMMALTNLSSHSPGVATRIVEMDGLMDKIELFLLENHILVRRAAMELICNLIAGCDELFEKYSRSERPSESKIQVLLALSDVHDLQTRLAASGALATLTSAPTACQVLFNLQLKRRRVFPILTRLIDPSSLSKDSELDSEDDDGDGDPGLIHRGIICARNFLLNIKDAGARRQIFSEAEKVGLKRALEKVVEGHSTNEILSSPTSEALKWLRDSQ